MGQGAFFFRRCVHPLECLRSFDEIMKIVLVTGVDKKTSKMKKINVPVVKCPVTLFITICFS